MKKIITLVFIGLSIILPLHSYANIAEGTSGSCKWVIDDEGVLTISPSQGEIGRLEKWEDWRSGVCPWYKYHGSITHVKFEKKIYTETCYAMFKDCELLETVDFGQFNIDASGNMEYMFSGCKSLKEIDMSTLNTDNVVYMNNMFANCTSIKSIDLSTFDTYKVKTMGMMFYNCISLEFVDVSRFFTTWLVEAQYMFFNCKKLKNIDLRFWDTSEIMDMTSMFDSCVNLQKVDLRCLDTYRLGYMKNAFRNCHSLESLNLTAVRGDRDTDFEGLFTGCESLKKFYAFNDDPFTWTIQEKMFNTIKEPEKIILYVPRASVELYKSAPGWKIFDVRAMEDEPKEATGEGGNKSSENPDEKSSDNTNDNTSESTDGNTSGSTDNHSSDTPVTGIGSIAATSKPSVVYSIGGSRLSAPRKGVNIINGKKYLVK